MPESASETPSETGADTSGPSSRRTSISSSGRPTSTSGRSGSGQSSRSTSFNLPDDARRGIRADHNGQDLGGEVEFGEEMDEESTFLSYVFCRLVIKELTFVYSGSEACGIRSGSRKTLFQRS